MNFGIDVINQIKNENPTLWTEEFQQEMINLITKGVELEAQYGRDTMPKPMLGMDAQKFEEYIKFIANRRFESIGLPHQYPGATNPFEWMSEMMDLNKEQNFFEGKDTAYQVSGQLKFD